MQFWLQTRLFAAKSATNTRKAVFLTLISTYGVEKNAHANMLVQNEVRMDDLFG